MSKSCLLLPSGKVATLGPRSGAWAALLETDFDALPEPAPRVLRTARVKRHPSQVARLDRASERQFVVQQKGK